MNLNKNLNQLGNSLIESVIAFALIAVLLTALFAGIVSTYNVIAKGNSIKQTVTALTSQVEKKLGTQSDSQVQYYYGGTSVSTDVTYTISDKVNGYQIMEFSPK